MESPEHKKIYNEICDFMGEDITAPACKEVADHLASCPECKVYFDTVRKTVTLCQELEKKETVPADVKERLFKVLDLDTLSAK
jgi:predicted anti-sigma-YlaC factor YlaD